MFSACRRPRELVAQSDYSEAFGLSFADYQKRHRYHADLRLDEDGCAALKNMLRDVLKAAK